MSNPFYTFAPTFVPGSLARSGDVNTQFTLVQNGFDKVNAGQLGIGTDSGSANTVLLAMSTPRTAYTNGDEYIFMAAAQNTGATTIKVDGLTTIPLTRFNGTPLQAGDLILSTWYAGRYSSALNSIEITSPAAYTSAAGIVSTAAPTHKVGLAAAGGVSINVLPVDATFAIDQSVAPTWTSLHTFSAGIAVNAAARNVASLAQTAQSYGNTTDNPTYAFLGSGQFSIGTRVTVGATGNVTINAPSSGTSLVVSGAAGAYVGMFQSAAANDAAIRLGIGTTGQQWDLRSDSSDGRFAILNQSSAIQPFSISTAGNVAIATPSSGGALTVAALASTAAASFQGPNTGTGFNVNFFDLTALTLRGFIGLGTSTVGGAAVTDFAISPGVGGSVVIGTSNGTTIGTRFGPNGNVTIAAPSSGNALAIAQAGGTAAVSVSGGTNPFIQTTDGTIVTMLQTLSGVVGVVGTQSNHQFNVRTNNTDRVVVTSTGNVDINAPSSGQHVINTVGQSTGLVIGVQSSGTQSGWMQFNDTTNANAVRGYIGSGSSLFTGAALADFGMASATGVLRLSANAGGNTHLQISSSGNVTINAPTSGSALVATGPAGNNAMAALGSATAGQSFGLSVSAGTNSSDAGFRVFNAAATAQYFQVRGDGVVFGNDGTNLFELGYKNAPLNTQSGNYTLVATDRGKTVQTGVTCTYTLNTGVFTSGGETVVLRAGAGAVLTISQGSGFTLAWAGNGATTGSRTLTGEGLATLLYTGPSNATISGAGLS